MVRLLLELHNTIISSFCVWQVCIVSIHLKLEAPNARPITHFYAFLAHTAESCHLHPHPRSSWKIINCWGYIYMLLIVNKYECFRCHRIDQQEPETNSSHHLQHPLIWFSLHWFIYRSPHNIWCILSLVWRRPLCLHSSCASFWAFIFLFFFPLFCLKFIFSYPFLLLNPFGSKSFINYINYWQLT